jgi:HlyD family secretion protein
MKTLPPIAVPASARWREFRIRALPLLVLAGTIGLTLVLWRQASPTASFPGQVEGGLVKVSSPKAGVVAQLTLSDLQSVHEGDVIARVVTTEPEIVQASLEVIRAEIHSVRANLGPILPRERLEMGYDRLRLVCLEQRVEVATTRAKRQLAESELHRTQQLFREHIVSQQALEEAQTTYDRLEAELKERLNLLKQQEASSQSKHLNGAELASSDASDQHSALEAAIRVQEARLRLAEAELAPIALRAPIDGLVSILHHRAGETVAAGEPIVTITAPGSDHIVAYLRRPFIVEPTVGATVEVRPRWLGRSAGPATIVRVGNRLEPVLHSLRLPGQSDASDVGLPVIVSVPYDLRLIPGEIVDVTFTPARGNGHQLRATR